MSAALKCHLFLISFMQTTPLLFRRILLSISKQPSVHLSCIGQMLLFSMVCKVLSISQKLTELAVSLTSDVTEKKAVNKRCWEEGKLEDVIIRCSNAGMLDRGTEVIKNCKSNVHEDKFIFYMCERHTHYVFWDFWK